MDVGRSKPVHHDRIAGPMRERSVADSGQGEHTLTDAAVSDNSQSAGVVQAKIY